MSKDYSYHVLSMDSAFFPEENKVRNQLFHAWHKLWIDVYKQSDAGYKLESDEFTRQNVAVAIFYKDQIAGIHLYSFYHLDNIADLKTKYFQFFSENYLEQLHLRKVKTVMSMEFLSVMPEFRKSKVGFSMGALLIQLGAQLFKEFQIDAIVAPARNDVGVNKMAYAIGFSCLEESTEQRGFICDLIACYQGDQKSYDEGPVKKLAEDLWERKKIYPSANQLLDVRRERNLPKAA